MSPLSELDFSLVVCAFLIGVVHTVLTSISRRKSKSMLSKLKRADFSEVVFVKEFGGSPDGFFKLLRNHHRSVQGLTFHIRYVEGTNKVIGIAYQGRGSVGRVTFPTGKAMENQMRLMAEFQSKMTTKEKL